MLDNLKALWSSFGNYVLQIIGRLIAKMLMFKAAMAVFNMLGGVGVGANIASSIAGAMSAQTHFGQMRQVPGLPGQPVPIIAHGSEIIGRPDGGGMGAGMAVTVMGDVFGWDEAMERIRNGLYNHQRFTGLSAVRA
jgi:tetrahydromethanopterin S-methyltransferase subunit D